VGRDRRRYRYCRISFHFQPRPGGLAAKGGSRELSVKLCAEGTPQREQLSPLLSDLVLDPLDRSWSAGVIVSFRSADDWSMAQP
jgi:hypothetical protein